MLKSGIRTIEKRGIHYVLEETGRPKRFKPWLGDCFAFLYDRIMEKSIFPKKFGGDIETHIDILRRELSGVQGQRVLELATGSGNAVSFLPASNHYTGTDISPGLLRQAVKRFGAAGFRGGRFYLAPADDLPFSDGTFDICLCHLALNFFDDLESVIREMKRVLLPGADFLCSVPLPERNVMSATIRGCLRSGETLRACFHRSGFEFRPLPDKNGSLLYFRAHYPGALAIS